MTGRYGNPSTCLLLLWVSCEVATVGAFHGPASHVRRSRGDGTATRRRCLFFGRKHRTRLCGGSSCGGGDSAPRVVVPRAFLNRRAENELRWLPVLLLLLWRPRRRA